MTRKLSMLQGLFPEDVDLPTDGLLCLTLQKRLSGHGRRQCSFQGHLHYVLSVARLAYRFESFSLYT